MNKDDLIKYGVIAAVGYFAYVWLRDNGYLAQMGIGTPAVAAGTATTLVQASTPVNTNSYPSVFVQPNNPTPIVVQATPLPPQQTSVYVPPPPAAPAVSLRAQMLNATQTDPAVVNGYAIADVWRYYYNMLRPPLMDVQIYKAFPGGTGNDTAPITLDQFLAALQNNLGISGMGAIVPVANVPQVPSMNFGGAGRSAFSSNRGGGRGQGGWLN